MTAKDLLVDDRRYGEAIEAIREGLPELDVVPPLTLVVETVYPVYTGALVIAPQQEEILRILDLVRQQEAYRLQRLLPPIDVVPQEQVVRLRWKAAILEEPQQVGVLAVYVPADFKGRLQLQENRLLQENLPRLQAEATDLGLRHYHGLSRPASSDCAQKFRTLKETERGGGSTRYCPTGTPRQDYFLGAWKRVRERERVKDRGARVYTGLDAENNSQALVFFTFMSYY